MIFESLFERLSTEHIIWIYSFVLKFSWLKGLIPSTCLFPSWSWDPDCNKCCRRPKLWFQGGRHYDHQGPHQYSWLCRSKSSVWSKWWEVSSWFLSVIRFLPLCSHIVWNKKYVIHELVNVQNASHRFLEECCYLHDPSLCLLIIWRRETLFELWFVMRNNWWIRHTAH